MGEPERRRRRLRPPSAAAAADPPLAETMAVGDPEDPDAAPDRPARRVPRAPAVRPTSGAGYLEDRDVERGLRGLVGSGSSQVSVSAALRARDAARPTEAHLADAEGTLAIMRRNWTPPEGPLLRGRA
jgi:hypothetical protein